MKCVQLQQSVEDTKYAQLDSSKLICHSATVPSYLSMIQLLFYSTYHLHHLRYTRYHHLLVTCELKKLLKFRDVHELQLFFLLPIFRLGGYTPVNATWYFTQETKSSNSLRQQHRQQFQTFYHFNYIIQLFLFTGSGFKYVILHTQNVEQTVQDFKQIFYCRQAL